MQKIIKEAALLALLALAIALIYNVVSPAGIIIIKRRTGSQDAWEINR